MRESWLCDISLGGSLESGERMTLWLGRQSVRIVSPINRAEFVCNMCCEDTQFPQGLEVSAQCEEEEKLLNPQAQTKQIDQLAQAGI